MLRAGLIAMLLITTSSCKKKPANNMDDNVQAVGDGEFVHISLDDEQDDLDSMFGSELMVATAECGDLIKLEPAAMMGKLSDAEIRCLDDNMMRAERMTTKDKISRVLLADAWAKQDEHRWEGVARRHLEEIDRSDPDMCYKFALYLSQKGPDRMEEALKWADVALENRSMWTGDLHVKRVYSLYKLKAMAAQKNWAYLEEQLAKEPSVEREDAVAEMRNLTKTLSREWLEYARSAGKDPSLAIDLCVSAAGTQEFCAD